MCPRCDARVGPGGPPRVAAAGGWWLRRPGRPVIERRAWWVESCGVPGGLLGALPAVNGCSLAVRSGWWRASERQRGSAASGHASRRSAGCRSCTWASKANGDACAPPPPSRDMGPRRRTDAQTDEVVVARFLQVREGTYGAGVSAAPCRSMASTRAVAIVRIRVVLRVHPAGTAQRLRDRGRRARHPPARATARASPSRTVSTPSAGRIMWWCWSAAGWWTRARRRRCWRASARGSRGR